MLDIVTKIASKEDAKDICDLARETFAMTYNSKLNPEDLDAYITRHMNINTIEQEIHNNDALYLLIYENDEKVGYLKLTWDETPLELSGRKALKIDKFYIVERRQRNGIGTLVMEEINEMARKSKHEAVWTDVNFMWGMNNFQSMKGKEKHLCQ